MSGSGGLRSTEYVGNPVGSSPQLDNKEGVLETDSLAWRSVNQPAVVRVSRQTASRLVGISGNYLVTISTSLSAEQAIIAHTKCRAEERSDKGKNLRPGQLADASIARAGNEERKYFLSLLPNLLPLSSERERERERRICVVLHAPSSRDAELAKPFFVPALSR